MFHLNRPDSTTTWKEYPTRPDRRVTSASSTSSDDLWLATGGPAAMTALELAAADEAELVSSQRCIKTIKIAKCQLTSYLSPMPATPRHSNIESHNRNATSSPPLMSSFSTTSRPHPVSLSDRNDPDISPSRSVPLRGTQFPYDISPDMPPSPLHRPAVLAGAAHRCGASVCTARLPELIILLRMTEYCHLSARSLLTTSTCCLHQLLH
jgi:hypothetical protein